MSIKLGVFKAKLADIINLVDAIFDGNREMLGWVIMAANAKGRECINALFPHGHIAWHATDPALPKDWRGFNIKVPDVVGNMETKLPLEITKGADLDYATPEALGLLLAMGVNRQGGNRKCSRLKSHGVGWLLMKHMIEFSRHKCLKTVRGQVLSENTAMLAMCAELGFHIADDPASPGVRTVTLPVILCDRPDLLSEERPSPCSTQ
jgi:hypothetical protein